MAFLTFYERYRELMRNLVELKKYYTNKPIISVIFGTRPEAIKMVPVIKALQKRRLYVDTVVISTGQHRSMLDQILERFGVVVDHDMRLMEPDQSLYQLSARAIQGFEKIINLFRPSLLLVQGDTTTAFLGALCAFYAKIPIGHVEAGLRTDKKYFPFPEEINRKLISVCADLNFAATEGNRRNLIRENVPERSIFVTGNTVIDAVLMALKVKPSCLSCTGKRLLLVTVHRRESFGTALAEMFQALRDIAIAYCDVEIVYPVHLNPNVRGPAYDILGSQKNIRLIEPLDYFDFVHLMKRAYLILTDSGGIQEEAPTLGVPVLVMRNETERSEAVHAGTVRLVGTDRNGIVSQTRLILDNPGERTTFISAINPYGDGQAAERIAYHLLRYFKQPAESFSCI